MSSTYTMRELAQEAQREAGFRHSVYDRLVDQGRMSRPAADRRILMMEAIAAKLANEAEAEEAAERFL
jgi:hypothetical protein